MTRAGAPPRPVVLLKLGGSLITEKERPDTPRLDRIRRLAGEIAGALPELEEALIIGHGSGSFGHSAAARHGLGAGPVGPEAGAGVVETQERAAALHRLVMDALREAGVPAFSVSPSGAVVAAAGAVAAWVVEPLVLALGLGLVPVLYGDVVLDREHRAAILSTETILEAVAERLERLGWRVRRALWAGATDGVLDEARRPIPLVRGDAPEAALGAARGAGATDVTGGMAHRLATALRLARRGVPSWIGDGREEGALARALRGETASGTRVLPTAGPDSPADAAGGH